METNPFLLGFMSRINEIMHFPEMKEPEVRLRGKDWCARDFLGCSVGKGEGSRTGQENKIIMQV